MKTSILTAFTISLISALGPLNGMAAPESNVLAPDQLRSRLEIRGEIFYFDSDGKRLLEKGHQWRVWNLRATKGKSEIESRWSSGDVQLGEFAIHHIWNLQSDGTLSVRIEEYAKVEDVKKPNGESEVKFVDLLKKDERILTDFSPISWVSVRPGQKRRVVVRFTPNLTDAPEPEKLTELPISGTAIMVTDNEGNLWTENTTLSGKYIGFTTHKGSLFLSYYPFKGASEIGLAKGNQIEVRLGGSKTATVTSRTAFLPEDVHAIVYGIYRPEQKTARLKSTHTRSSNQEGRFLESINQPESR